jgi:hypothetical protein
LASANTTAEPENIPLWKNRVIFFENGIDACLGLSGIKMDLDE